MLYLEDNTQFMKNVVAGISSECFMKGVHVRPKGVELVIKNTLLIPDLNFSYNPETRKEELTRLADTCIEILCGEDKGLRKLYELQAIFHSEYSSDDHVLREYESLKSLYIAPLLKKIISSQPVKDEKFEETFRLIVTYALLLTGMGDPRDPDTFKECEEVFMSIFSFSDLSNLFLVEGKEKIKMLTETAYVIGGILLYNRIKNKGGLGIENYPFILGNSLDSLASIFLIHIQHAQEAAMASTRVVTDQIYWGQAVDGNENLAFYEHTDLSDEEFTYAFWMSLIQQQVVSYMRRLYFNIRHYSELMEHWQEKFLNCSQKIDEAINYRIVVPTKVIFPLFTDLFDKWKIFYQGIVIVSVYEKVLAHISDFLIFEDTPKKVKDVLSSIEKRANLMEDWFNCQEKLNLSDKDFYNMLTKVKITKLAQELNRPEPYDSDDDTVEVINPEKVKCQVINPTKKEISNYDIMFGGFDPVYLVEGNGVLSDIVGEIGLLKHNDRYFGFRDIKSAYKFGVDPDKYIGKVIDFVRRHPHYIDIFQLREYMDKFRGRKAFSETILALKPVAEKNVQTEVHPIPSYIDNNYTHNIWEARANYCRMATISTKATRTCQTLLSYMKMPIGTQTYPMKDSEMQTMQDNWANTPMPSVYRYGLRGRRDAEYHEVSLTLPVEEPHKCIVKPSEVEDILEKGVQTEGREYFGTCFEVKIDPHPPMFYTW